MEQLGHAVQIRWLARRVEMLLKHCQQRLAPPREGWTAGGCSSDCLREKLDCVVDVRVVAGDREPAGQRDAEVAQQAWPVG
ncbi:MAG: hypothetical protein ACRDRJ_32145 [Streptosporangiaceae bacterium]